MKCECGCRQVDHDLGVGWCRTVFRWVGDRRMDVCPCAKFVEAKPAETGGTK